MKNTTNNKWVYLYKLLARKKSLLILFFVTIFYIALSTYLLNISLFAETLLSNTSIIYKVTIFMSLFIGSWTAQSFDSFAFMLLTGLLLGINILLLKPLLQQKQPRASVAASTVIGITSSGCAACGFSLIPFLGIGGIGLVFFVQVIFRFIAIFLLCYSLYFILTQATKEKYCRI